VAFPMGQNPPSLGDFIDTCVKIYGAELLTLDFDVEGSFGKIRPRVLERKVDGETLHVVVPNLPDDVLINFHTVRQMCRRLGVPTEAFGFQFDEQTGQIHLNAQH
jgi:hypothetical protein